MKFSYTGFALGFMGFAMTGCIIVNDGGSASDSNTTTTTTSGTETETETESTETGETGSETEATGSETGTDTEATETETDTEATVGPGSETDTDSDTDTDTDTGNSGVAGCGWNADADYYDCTDNNGGGVDPSQMAAIKCPDVELVNDGECGEISGVGCCSDEGALWYCDVQGDMMLATQVCE